MIGKNLLFEAITDEAVEAFARCARDCRDIRMVFATEEELNTFWLNYRPDTPMPRATTSPSWRRRTCSARSPS